MDKWLPLVVSKSRKVSVRLHQKGVHTAAIIYKSTSPALKVDNVRTFGKYLGSKGI